MEAGAAPDVCVFTEKVTPVLRVSVFCVRQAEQNVLFRPLTAFCKIAIDLPLGNLVG